MSEMTQAEAVQEIRDALERAEFAIRNHPDATLEAYELGMDQLKRNQATVEALSPEVAASGLTLEEVQLIWRYFFATGFMSGWYHLNGEKDKRDTLCHSAGFLSAAAGVPAEIGFRAVLDAERAARDALSRIPGVHPTSKGGGFMVLLVVAASILFLARFC